MYKHILITTDGSELAGQGVSHGLALAAATGAKVTVLTVTPPYPMIPSVMGEATFTPPEALREYDLAQTEGAQAILAEVKAAAEKMAVEVQVLHVPEAQPADAIIHCAEEEACDLICMASHGRQGIRRMLLGSQAAEVVGKSRLPVLIVR